MSKLPNPIHRTNPACSFRGCPRSKPIPIIAGRFVSGNAGHVRPSFTVLNTLPDESSLSSVSLESEGTEQDSRNSPGAPVPDDSFGGLQGLPTKFRESATNILGSVARISSSIFQSGIEMAQTIMLGDIDKKSREDVIKFNGFTIKVFGNVLTLNSIHVNDGDGKDNDDGDGNKKLSLKVNVGNGVNVKYAHPILGDNTWTLNFPAIDAFIQIKAPLGVNSETISWECDKFSEDEPKRQQRQRVLTVTVQ